MRGEMSVKEHFDAGLAHKHSGIVVEKQINIPDHHGQHQKPKVSGIFYVEKKQVHTGGYANETGGKTKITAVNCQQKER